MMAEIDDVIRSRRSVKPSDFRDERVPDELIERMLENANWAPNHGRTEPWRFFVFCDEARSGLASTLIDIYHRVTPPETVRETKVQKLKANITRSSHVIVIAMKRQATEKIPEIEEIEAVACAVQNLHLTATACGVAGYWSSPAFVCSNEFRDELGLGSKDRVLGLFYAGLPNPDLHLLGERQPITDKVRWFRSPQT